jgi:hypothetical protein
VKTLIALPLALGIALTSSAAAFSANRGYEQLHSYRAIHRRTAVPRAEVAPPATIFGVPGPWGYPLNSHRTDGLSRDPSDCLKYGCIDNGGG